MASPIVDTIFTSGTTITSNWLNGVNDAINDATQDITGATPRTVVSKLADTVSVKDFGAVGDGVTDDTAAIQAAIDYIKLKGGGVVDFPFANYKISSNLTIFGDFGFGGVKLVGNNSQITSTANAPAIRIDAYDTGGPSSAPEYRINAVVDGFYLYGPGVASTESTGVRVQNAANVLIQNCSIRNFYYGLVGSGALITKYENLNISKCNTGIYFIYTLSPVTFGANDNHFISCRVWDNVKAVYYYGASSSNVTFDYCEIEGNNLASTGVTDGVAVIDIYRSGKITFNGCYIEQNEGQYNIKYSSFNADSSLNFIGCQFLLNGDTGYGIYLDETVGVPSSLTMIGCSIGTTFTSDLYIGTGFSVFLMNTPISKPITGNLSKLSTYRNGKYTYGTYTSEFAPMLLNGAANSDGIGLDVNGLLRLTDATGANRYGYITSGATTASFQADSGRYLSLGLNSGTARVWIGRSGTAQVEPSNDNAQTLGSATNRWSTVYAGTGTINTSDARAKQQVRSLSDAERAVAVRCKSLVRAFKFNDSVTEKGDGARIHFGVIAQDVIEAFKAEGLDATSYGLLCYDEWDAYYEDEVDENGNPTGNQTLVHAAGSRYGIRYEQLLAFIIGVM